MAAHDNITSAIRSSVKAGRPALVGFLTAGFPTRERFSLDVQAVASVCDVVEIGVPFTDPMADGTTIQRASFIALAQGTTLQWILHELQHLSPRPKAPILLMSYLNPLLAYGMERLPRDAEAAGVSGFIVPDLPFEESDELRASLGKLGLALVQMVTPVTPDARLAQLCKAAQGFVYAVTMTGTTGKMEGAGAGATATAGAGAGGGVAKATLVPADVLAYMDRVKRASPVPVCAGFGIRSRDQVACFAPHVDGVIVGSALVECLERGEDVAGFLKALR